MKVSSSVGAAQDAVSGFAGIDVASDGQQVSLGSSNISSMKNGTDIANQLLKHVSGVVSGAKGQADNMTALAAEIEARDRRDAGSTGGKL